MFMNRNPKKLTGRDYYFQIPSNAEIKAIPFNSLPLHVQQKFHQMDHYIDGSNAPHVIFVSPVTKCTRQINHKLAAFDKEIAKQKFSEGNHRTTNKLTTGDDGDPEDCFVPITSSKEIASTILQLSRTSNEKTTFIREGNTLQKVEDGLLLNLRVVDIRAQALYKHKNAMYLLPAQSAKVSGEQDSPEIMESASSSHGTMKYKCNKMGQSIFLKGTKPNATHHGSPMYTDSILNNSVLIPQQTHKEIQFSKKPPMPNPPYSRSLQPDQSPLVMEQIQRKFCPEDSKAVKKRPYPGGSVTIYNRAAGTISSASSIRKPEAPLKSSPYVSEESPGFSHDPIKILPSKERIEPVGSSVCKPLLNMEPQIPQSNQSYEGCADLESRSSSPFSDVTTDTSEDFESDQSERSICNKSPPPGIRRRPDQGPSLRQQDETTQDKATQRIKQNLKELFEMAEQVKRQISCEDAKVVKERPNPGFSDTNFEGNVGTFSSTSSIMQPKAPLKSSPCVPEKFHGNSIQMLLPIERAERAESSLSKPFLNMEPKIPQSDYNNKGCTDFDSRSSSPSSAVTTSTDTSEGSESDQSERWITNKSPPPGIGRMPDQVSLLRQQDETTQDEIKMRLEQRVKELNELVENMRNKRPKI